MRKIKSYMAKLINTKKRKDTSIGVVSIFLIVAMISGQLIAVNAIDRGISDKPSFDVEIISTTPNPAMIGEDILVKGKIIPKEFEVEKQSKSKEIVLVLDTSGSMSKEIDKECTYKYDKSNEYCKEHNKKERHRSTRISELKKAANNFIDKMSKVKNTKIALVSYDTYSTIEQTNKDISDNIAFYKVDTTDELKYLKDKINGLKADGGTNTGEGLRKAEYLFEYYNDRTDKNQNKILDSSGDKIIVFMSDGIPTYYSSNNVFTSSSILNPNYYTKISSNHPNSIGGTGYEISPDQLDLVDSISVMRSCEYAKKISNIIENKKNISNIFSIGYGNDLNKNFVQEIISEFRKWFWGNDYTNGTDILKDMHESMGGKVENFYSSADDAIDGIFNKIADKIIEGYTINNLEMNMNFKVEDGIHLKTGGNIVKLNSINYVGKEYSNGIITYTANPIDFQFVIKGSKKGKFINVFEKSKVKFSWNNTEMYIPLNLSEELIININDNILPNIETNLMTNSNIELESFSDIIDVKYSIQTESFKYNLVDLPETADEVTLLLDLSSPMKDKQRLSNAMNAIRNKFIENNEIKNNNTKFRIVGISNKLYINSENYKEVYEMDKDSEKLKNLLNYIQDNMDKLTSDERLIDNALGTSENLFSNESNNKALVLISSGNLEYSQEVINKITKNNFKTITLDLSGETEGNLSTKKFHSKLNGEENDYIIKKDDDGNFNNIEVEFEYVIDRLKVDSDEKLTIKNARVFFDLGLFYEMVESNSLQPIDGQENKYLLELPNIKYSLYNDEIRKEKLWRQLEPLEYTFKVRRKEDSEYGRKGFGPIENNILKYSNFSNKEITKNLKTVTSNYINRNVVHGVYTGISSNNPNINIGMPNYPKDSRINFGAYFKYSGESQATLNISEECEVVIDEPINIYKINTNNELQLLNTIQVSSSKSYSINLSELGLTSGDNVLIVYNEKIIVSGETQLPKTFVNTIKLDNSNPVNASVNITDLEMPELY
ncbi:VWA domain-containing protein [Clostridium botulinum]|nr:VWA domain-containing protein [Clostridium botulinum]